VPAGGAGLALAGFDAAVAKANGYEIVTLPDGSTASVQADRTAAARAGTYRPTTGVLRASGEPGGGVSAQMAYEWSEVPGDCGASKIHFWSIGSSMAYLRTGFYLIPSAGSPWDIHWTVNISDGGGQSTQYWNEYQGNNYGSGWDAGLRMLSLTRGTAIGVVNQFSFVITTRGWICYSYGPIVYTVIY
jgi:hypothetical protein